MATRIGGRYMRVRNKEAVFGLLCQGEPLHGVVLVADEYFNSGVYELQELEVWRIHKMLESEHSMVFCKSK